ncbi:MAG: site-2 protease family protein, partial [Candidatus Aquicultor secundus]
LPGFPLDGGRVLRSIIWYFTGNLRRSTSIAATLGRGIAYTMIFIGIAGPFFTNNLSLIWFILLGWYLLRAAQAEYQQVLYHEALENVKVSEIMTPDPETVSPDVSVQGLVEEHFLKHNWVAYPVVENGTVQGMVTLKSVQNLPRSEWNTTRVGAIMRPLSSDIVTQPDAEVLDILQKLVTKAEGRMVVVQDGRLVGILTGTDVTRATIRRLHLKEQMGRPAA